MEKTPALPAKPTQLVDLETRRAAIRTERQEVETELARIEEKVWQESQTDGDALDQAAERLATGGTEVTSQTVVPEQIEIMRSRRDLLRLAEQKVAARLANGRSAHNRNVAGAYRPEHKKVAQRIARALRELVDANRAEQELRDRAPGGTLPPMDFPNIGQLGAVGGSAKFWMQHAGRHGYLNEDDGETEWPAAAL